MPYTKHDMEARKFVDQHLPQGDLLLTFATRIDLAAQQLRNRALTFDEIDDVLMETFAIALELHRRVELVKKV